MSKQDTAHLFNQFCKGYGPSIKTIYKQCFPSVKNHILKNSGTVEDAADTFQEGLVVLLGYCKKTFNLKVNACGFLFGICYKTWLKYLRKNNKNPLTNVDISEYENIIAAVDNLEEEMRFARCLRILNDLIDSMEKREGDTLRLFYIERKSYKEIAQILKFKNANTVKTQRFKYFGKLKKLADKHPDFNDFCFDLFT